MFYGQHREDEYLSKLFEGKTNGVCVDVGAYDGILGNNTYYFEKLGWNCISIEPIPEQFNKCKLFRKNSIECCVGLEDNKDVTFTVFSLFGTNQSAISGLVPDQRLIESHSSMITNRKEIVVKQRTLTSILDEFNFPSEIDFISIDTENTELDVLKSLDFNKYKVKVFCIENNFNEPYLEEYLKQYGYVKINRIAVNDFYTIL
jgi:FkbM family methyltransferase